MGDADCQNIRIGFQVIALETVEVVARHRSRPTGEPWQAIVGRIVFPLMQITQRNPRWTAKTHRKAWGQTVATALSYVAIGHFRLMRHRIDPERSGIVQQCQGTADVSCATASHVVAEVDAHRSQGIPRRRLAGLIDYATGRATPEDHRGWSFEHLDSVQIKRVAGIAAEIAHTVQEHVVSRGKAANTWVISLPAEFASTQSNARHGAQSVAQGGYAAVIHELS